MVKRVGGYHTGCSHILHWSTPALRHRNPNGNAWQQVGPVAVLDDDAADDAADDTVTQKATPNESILNKWRVENKNSGGR